MHDSYDAIVIGSGRGVLKAGALFAIAEHKALVREQNESL